MELDYGPFTFEAGNPLTLNGKAVKPWTLRYGSEHLATLHLPEASTRSSVLDTFGYATADKISQIKRSGQSFPVRLQTADDEILGEFLTPTGWVDGMKHALPNESSTYWLVATTIPVFCMPVTLTQFAALASQYTAERNEWIQTALPRAVLTLDPAQWRAPTNWELRHVVGEGSFTGVTGAQAAELVGVTAQNFRKYLARDGASTRQAISFAMWHLLLARLGVTRI